MEGRTMHRKRGQSLLEYMLVIAAILVAVVAAATTFIKPAATKTMEESGKAVEGAAGKLGAGLGTQ